MPPFISQGNNQELNHPKDKTLESGYGQVKSQVKTLTKKICFIWASCALRSIDLDSLTHLPQTIMPPKFKALEFVMYDGTRDPCAHQHIFCRNMETYGDNHPSLCQIFPDNFTGPTTT